MAGPVCLGCVLSSRSRPSCLSRTRILGGAAIERLPLNTVLRQTSLPTAVTNVTTDSDMPTSYRTYLQLTIPGASGSPFTFYSAELYGRRLSLFFNASNQPVLTMDGVPVDGGTGSAATGSPAQVQVSFKISHPYAQNTPNPACGAGNFSFADQCGTRTLFADTSYVIGNGWGGVGRGTMEIARKHLKENIAAETTPDMSSESILGQALHMLGLLWIAENGAAADMIGRIAKVGAHYHHSVGLVGSKKSGTLQEPFVDLPYNLLSVAQLTERWFTNALAISEMSVAFAALNLGSALEAGVVEQTQLGNTAVSTTRLVDFAAVPPTELVWLFTDPAQIMDLDVKADMTNNHGWPLSIYNELVSLAQNGHRLAVPLRGNYSTNQWTGYAYWHYKFTPTSASLGAIINGLSGGFSTQFQNHTQAVGNIERFLSGNSQIETVAQFVAAYGGGFQVQPFGGDPVNLLTGSYLYEHEDMKVGSGEFPYALPFVRSYNSGNRLKKTALGPGWMHNFDITALVDSAGMLSLDDGLAVDFTAVIEGAYVMLDLFNDSLPPYDWNRFMTANSVAEWTMRQMIGNVVHVTQPGNIERFARKTDSSYDPPLGSASELIRNGDGTFTYKTKDKVTINFNAAGKIANWNHPAGPVVNFTYDGSNKLTSVSNGMGRALTFSYTGDNLTQVSDGNGRTVGLAYDSAGNLQSCTDPLSNATTYEYDVPGRLTKIFYPTFPSNAYVTNTYDDFDRVMEQKDALGNLSKLYFAGSRAEIVNPLNRSDVHYFSPRGKTLFSINALGQVTAHEYDKQDRLTKTTMPEGNALSYTYDGKHNVLTETHAPKAGSPLSPVVKTFTYDATYNKVATVTDENGRVTTSTYDPATGNLTGVDLPAVGGQTPQWSYAYNGRGQKTAETDPMGKVTAFTYSPSNETLLSMVEELGHGPAEPDDAVRVRRGGQHDLAHRSARQRDGDSIRRQAPPDGGNPAGGDRR